VPCGQTDREYEAWFHRTFGGGYEVFHDGPDAARIRDLTGEPKAEAERMLRRGLGACSSFAVSAIQGAGWRDLIPDLTRAVAADSSEFRAHVILALEDLGSRDDFSDELIAVLSTGSTQARMTAAMGARRFSLERFRGPLLDRVRQDPSWLVRNHAAQSLYVLADIYPRDLHDHPDVAMAVSGEAGRGAALVGLLDRPPPLTAEQRARLAVAAEKLDAEIAARLAAGRCWKPTPPTTVDLHVIPVNARRAVALTVEETVGSCERKLAFLVFVESAGGFGRWRVGGVSGGDPLKTELPTPPSPVTVTYTRATGLLTVGALTIDPAKSNVAVLSAGTKGVEVRYQGKLNLTFERHGRPAYETGVSMMDSRPEIELAVRALVDRTPEVRGLVGGAPGTANHP
jgi:hypothetical protein